MSLPFMPFYTGDHMRDIGRLTTEQHGAYFFLIIEYWNNGSLPDDDEQLALITKLPLAKWRKIRPVIQAFFRDGWKHKRIDAELAKAKSVTESRRKAANARWLRRADQPLLAVI